MTTDHAPAADATLRWKMTTRTTRTILWTETDDGWRSGPLVVAPWKRENSKWVWQVFLNGRLISRPQGYSSAAEAMSAAGLHKAVRRLMEEESK
jgi:hypothetical protein